MWQLNINQQLDLIPFGLELNHFKLARAVPWLVPVEIGEATSPWHLHLLKLLQPHLLSSSASASMAAGGFAGSPGGRECVTQHQGSRRGR